MVWVLSVCVCVLSEVAFEKDKLVAAPVTQTRAHLGHPCLISEGR
jgi:hypothetical protein